MHDSCTRELLRVMEFPHNFGTSDVVFKHGHSATQVREKLDDCSSRLSKRSGALLQRRPPQNSSLTAATGKRKRGENGDVCSITLTYGCVHETQDHGMEVGAGAGEGEVQQVSNITSDTVSFMYMRRYC